MKFEPTTSYVEAFRQRVGDLPDRLPVSTERAMELLRDGGYFCPPEVLASLVKVGAVDCPESGIWELEHMLSLVVALHARQLWRPGHHDDLKTKARLMWEAGGEARAAVLAESQPFDLLMLLHLIADGSTHAERREILEHVLIRFTMLPPVEEKSCQTETSN